MSLQSVNLKVEQSIVNSLQENANKDLHKPTRFLKQDLEQTLLTETEEENKPEDSSIRAIENANKKSFRNEKEFKFSIHKETKQIMVKVIDKNTQEVIKEFPSENILDMVAKMCENAGLFVDEKR